MSDAEAIDEGLQRQVPLIDKRQGRRPEERLPQRAEFKKGFLPRPQPRPHIDALGIIPNMYNNYLDHDSLKNEGGYVAIMRTEMFGFVIPSINSEYSNVKHGVHRGNAKKATRPRVAFSAL